MSKGRGFAVVAAEVRSLAQRSAEAAKEIKTLIGASVDSVASGTRLVTDAGSTMGDIVQSVRRVAEVIGEITAAAAEQSAGIAHVNEAIGNLDQMTQQKPPWWSKAPPPPRACANSPANWRRRWRCSRSMVRVRTTACPRTCRPDAGAAAPGLKARGARFSDVHARLSALELPG